MSKYTDETRNEVDEEPEEGEIQDDEGSLEDVSSEDEILTVAKRQKSEVYARGVRLQHGQFAKRGRQLTCTRRREMRLCSSQKSDSALKKRQTTPRSGSRATGTHESYFEGQRYLKELFQKVSGKIHEKENKVKDIKKARRRSASFHSSGSEQRSTSEHAESYFSSTSSKGLWHKGDVKEKHKKKKKNSKSNKTNNPLVEVYETQLKSAGDSSSVNTCMKSAVQASVGLVMHQKGIEVEKGKTALSPSSPSSSDIVILDVPVTVPEVITIVDSDEEVLKKEKEEKFETQMTSTEKEGSGSTSNMLHSSAAASLVKVSLENDTDDHEDNLKLLREAALNSSKPEKCSNVSCDDEVLQLRLEALRSAIIRKYEERKKRGITLAKSSRISGEKHVMSISPLGSPNHCSSGDSSDHVDDEVDPELNFPVEIDASSNYHGTSDHANDSELDKISTVDMELAESDEEREQVHTELVDGSSYKTIVTNIEIENNNFSNGDDDAIGRQPVETGYLVCSTEERLPSAPTQCVSSTSVAPIEMPDASLGYIIGDQEQLVDFVQEVHVSVSPPMHFHSDSQSEIGNDNEECANNVEVDIEKCEILLPDQRHVEVSNSEQIPNEEKRNNVQCSLSDETISSLIQPAGCSTIFNVGNAISRNDEILDAVSGRSDSSYVSTLCGELDLESMIVLDEIGRCSDDEKSVGTEEEGSGSGEFQNGLYDAQNNSENCDSEDNTELCEENLGFTFNNLLCNSRSSSEIIQSNSDNYEASEDNTDIFEGGSMGKLFDIVSNAMIPEGENVYVSSEKLNVCEDNLQTLGEHSRVKLDIISSTSRNSIELSLHKSVHDLSSEEPQNMSENSPICEKMDVPHSQCDAVLRVSDNCSQNNVKTGTLNISREESVFSSDGNGKSSVNCDNFPREDTHLIVEKPIFSSSCNNTTVSSPSHCVKQVQKPEQEENQCSLGALQQKENTQSTVNVFSTKNTENISSNNDNSTEDEETVLRVSLLAMLKKRADDLKNKQKQETTSSLKSDFSDNLHVSSLSINGSSVKNVMPSVPHSSSCVTEFASCASYRNNGKSNISVLNPLSLSHSSTIARRMSSIHSISKNVVYPSRNLSSVSLLGPKASKHRARDSKTQSRFKVNVPKLVINLGEDSDSGEDDKCDPLESLPISNIHGCDTSEEARDNVSGSQSVPPDFERKLDMLLKQARFQQEAHTKEDKEDTHENLSNTGLCRMVTFPSKLYAHVGKSHGVISGSSSIIQTTSSSKVSSVVVEDAQEKRTCGDTSKNKIMHSDKSVDMTKLSSCRKAETSKQDIQVRAKHTSTVAHAGPSVSSVVDIGLLSSCKQKEYMRLKKQLAQLARKETGVKAKENITLVNTSRLPMKKSGMEEGKLQTSSSLRNSTIKNSVVIGTERSPFTRKFVRRGQGGTLTLRNEFGKSRRIVRTVSTSYNLQTHLRNRLTVTAPNRIGSASTEGTSVVRRVLCVPQKRIVTAVSGAKKVSSGIQVTTPNIHVNADEKQRKLLALIVNRSAESTNTLENTHFQRKCTKMNNESERRAVDSVSSSSDVQNVLIGKNVVSKRKGSNSEHNEESARKKISVQQDYCNDQTTNGSDFQTTTTTTTTTDSKSNHESEVNECISKLSDSLQESSIEKSIYSVKRKKNNSEHNVVHVRRKSVVAHELSKEKSVCSDDSSEEAAEAAGVVDGALPEKLWSSEGKLISKRYQVLEDIATVQQNLHEIERVNVVREQIMRDIQRLKEEMSIAETQLSKKETLLKVLYSEVENAKRDIMRKQSETLLLSVECEEMGGKVHGSNYNVPNACVDLIRTGMGKISKTLEHLKKGKPSAEPDCETSTISSGELLPNETKTTQLNSSALAENVEDCGEDSSKQNPGSYLSPLEAIKPGVEPSSVSLPVLCPYHIMGSCKDKECSYLH